MLGEKAARVTEIIEELREYSKENFNEEIEVQNYFTGICDLSYGMFVSDQSAIDYIENNMLMWGDVYSIPLEEIKEVSMPVLNLGPWGKDLHQYMERVYKDDLFNKTPFFTDLLIKKLFQS